MSGPASLVVAVTCRDTTDLYRYITERLAPITAIRQHEVTVTVRHLKQAGTVMDGDRLPRLELARKSPNPGRRPRRTEQRRCLRSDSSAYARQRLLARVVRVDAGTIGMSPRQSRTH